MSVAIKIPLFNATTTILDTLSSILNQTHQDFIIYVYDNASTDSSIEKIQSLKDSRIVIVAAEKNRGWNWNFNRCLGVCDEDYLLIAHADDVYHSEFIEKNIDALKKYEPRLLFSSGTQFRTTDEIDCMRPVSDCLDLEVFRSHENLLNAIVKKGNFIFCPTAFGYSSDMRRLISFFDGDRFGGSADLDAWLRYVSVQPIGLINTKGLFFQRLSETQISYKDLAEDDSVFVKCCSSHIKSVSIQDAKRAELELCLKWHEFYYRALKYLTGLNTAHLPTMKELVAIISAKVSSIKKIKLISLILLCRLISYLPYAALRVLSSPLVKYVRKSG